MRIYAAGTDPREIAMCHEVGEPNFGSVLQSSSLKTAETL